MAKAMKDLGKKIAITVASMIILVVCAILLYEPFQHFVLGQFKDLNVTFVSNGLRRNSPPEYIFAVVAAMLPALFLFAHFILKDQKLKVLLFIAPITLICGIGLMMVHIYIIRGEILDIDLPSYIQKSYPISNVHVERHLGIGFILGTVITIAILSFTSRDRKS